MSKRDDTDYYLHPGMERPARGLSMVPKFDGICKCGKPFRGPKNQKRCDDCRRKNRSWAL